MKKDFESVFIEDVPRHIVYEVAWAAGTGIPRLMRAINGNFEVKVNNRILSEILSGR